jgi:metal-dependent amidase/aminoacylase/carboxypeptidase family protein
MQLIDSILTQAASIAAVRRDIHAHPELCFQEVRTADVVAGKLTEWGIEVHRGLGTTGLVGVVHGRDGGACGRAIGLRADMDALPMQEHNTFAHASQHAGKMHACGHDGHTAMLLAAAQHFAKHRNFDGTVYLIFQPAEEGGGGAREMIKDGLFDKFPVTMKRKKAAVSTPIVMAAVTEIRAYSGVSGELNRTSKPATNETAPPIESTPKVGVNTSAISKTKANRTNPMPNQLTDNWPKP